MPPFSLIAMAVGLSMDAFAVSVNNGVSTGADRQPHPFLLPLFFGVFQGMMTLAGWMTGSWASAFLASVDHWVAFFLLSAVGVKMLHEAWRDSPGNCAGALGFCTLLALSVATSLDALAVGISLSFLNSSILDPVVIIGLTTFALSLVGVCLGRMAGRLAGNRFQVLGGAVLIGIGVKILLEHTL
jgi:manganese efflux pump family protein